MDGLSCAGDGLAMKPPSPFSLVLSRKPVATGGEVSVRVPSRGPRRLSS